MTPQPGSARILRTSVTVAVSADRAFALSVLDVGRWWRRGTPYWMEPNRAVEFRFEPRVGGRLLEVRDAATGEGLALGRITAYEPGRRLAFTWRLPFWAGNADSHVEVIFEALDKGRTRVALTHDFSRATGQLADGRDYFGGWKTLLGYYEEHVAALEREARL